MYRHDINALKGIAIIAVVLYHLGIIKSGYLGVDLFFVINGYLIIPSIYKNILNEKFNYFSFIKKRTIRLLPLVIFASLICLIFGYIGMLPDDFENLSQSVIASNLMANNILSSITSNYWDVASNYKPLMHTWYLGILFQFYLIFPIIAIITARISKIVHQDISKSLCVILFILMAGSFLMYILPYGQESHKFYLLQYRFFELALGGIAGLKITINNKSNTKISYIVSLLLIFVIFSSLCTVKSLNSDTIPIGSHPNDLDGLILPRPVLLILTVLLSVFSISLNNKCNFILNNQITEYFGKRCYSIFIWHQVFIAFYRYYISNDIDLFIILYLVITLLISEISYRYIEQRIKDTTKNFIYTAVSSVIVILISSFVYIKAGVVRNIPELDVYTTTSHRGMWSEYCDRIYEYDKDFLSDTSKINVLVVGVSFGRDFANVLLESSYKDEINLSYGYYWDKSLIDRVRKSDYIFSFSSKLDVPEFVWQNLKADAEIWGIGTKNFGESNGIIYRQRFSDNYKKLTIPLDSNYDALNQIWASEWGEHYINFIDMSLAENGQIRIFTPEGKFISQDCRHLTKAGAMYFASKIDFKNVFGF